MVLPLDDKYSVTRNELQDQLTYAMGGRVAEEIVFHDPTTGASNDIEKATGIARKMVTEYGMTNEVGPVKLGSASGEVFMGRDMGHGREFSEKVAERIDNQVRALIEQAHNEAYQVLNDNRDVLDRLALELLEKETLDHIELAEIFKDVKRLPPRPQWLSSNERPVSYQPPVEVPRRVQPEPASPRPSRPSRALPRRLPSAAPPVRRDPRPRRLGPWPSTVSASPRSSASCSRRSGRIPSARACG